MSFLSVHSKSQKNYNLLTKKEYLYFFNDICCKDCKLLLEKDVTFLMKKKPNFIPKLPNFLKDKIKIKKTK